MPVLKKNNRIRICGDSSVTVNPNLIVDDHPLPTVDELFASMADGRIFSKIDLEATSLFTARISWRGQRFAYN